MKPAAILLIFCQWLFAGVSLSAHSMDFDHDNHERMHVHLEQGSEPVSDENENTDSSHIHFPLEPLVQHLVLNDNYSPGWTLFGSQLWLSQSYRPSLPPPTLC